MNIILWRHAEAKFDVNDLARELTPKGKKQASKMARILKSMLPEQTECWVSEAKRSQETAAFLPYIKKVCSALNPEAHPMQIAQLLLEIPNDKTVVIVGHQPWLGQLCAFMLNQNWETSSYWSIKKAAFWWFEAEVVDEVFLAKLQSMRAP